MRSKSFMFGLLSRRERHKKRSLHAQFNTRRRSISLAKRFGKIRL